MIPTSNIFPVSPFVRFFCPAIPPHSVLLPSLSAKPVCNSHIQTRLQLKQIWAKKVTGYHMVPDFLVADSTYGSLAKTHGYYLSLTLLILLYEDLHLQENYSGVVFLSCCGVTQDNPVSEPRHRWRHGCNLALYDDKVAPACHALHWIWGEDICSVLEIPSVPNLSCASVTLEENLHHKSSPALSSGLDHS